MANQLKAVVTADIRQFTRSMLLVGNAADAASVAAVAAFAAVIASVVALDKAGIEAAATYEELALALKFATGDAKLANDEFAKLVDFADRTPFDTSDLIKYSVQLRNVTENAFGTAEQIKTMAGALAVAKTLGRDKTFVNSVGRIISAFQTGSGAISRYLRTLRNSSKFSAAAAIELKELAKRGGGAAAAIEIMNKEFSKSKGNVAELAASTKGLQSTLRSVAEITLAGLGSKGLDEYKSLLVSITEQLREIRETEAFDKLGGSLERFNATLTEISKSGGFQLFLTMVEMIVDAVTVLVAALKILSELVIAIPDSLNVLAGGAPISGSAHSSESMFSRTFDAAGESAQGIMISLLESVATNTAPLNPEAN